MRLIWSLLFTQSCEKEVHRLVNQTQNLWTSSRTIVRIGDKSSHLSALTFGHLSFDFYRFCIYFDIVAPFDKTCCVVDFSRQRDVSQQLLIPATVMRYCRERLSLTTLKTADGTSTTLALKRNTPTKLFSPFYAKSPQPIPNTSLQIPVAISPIQSVAMP
ncbi:hypothetical protein TNCV_4307571 [Trichonephila clavipes]|nr:hypothetical protein TNCV_4307571 [Trichonephila clavipes]